jgi:hypothetical protein
MSAILEHLVKDVGVTVEQAKAAMAAWEIRPMVFRGVQVGELMIKNNEVHFALNPECRKVMGRKQLMFEVVTSLLSEKKFLVTRLFKNAKEAALVEAFGFAKIRSDDNYDYYWMNEGDPIRAGSKRKAEAL